MGHALLRNAAARILHGDQLFLDAELVAQAFCDRSLGYENERAGSEPLAEGTEHGPVVHRPPLTIRSGLTPKNAGDSPRGVSVRRARPHNGIAASLGGAASFF